MKPPETTRNDKKEANVSRRLMSAVTTQPSSKAMSDCESRLTSAFHASPSKADMNKNIPRLQSSHASASSLPQISLRTKKSTATLPPDPQKQV